MSLEELLTWAQSVRGLTEKDDEDADSFFRYEEIGFSLGYVEGEGWWAAFWEVDDPIMSYDYHKTPLEALAALKKEVDENWKTKTEETK